MTVKVFKKLLELMSQEMINTYKGKWGKVVETFDRYEWFEFDNVEGFFGWNDNEPDTIYLLYEGSDEKEDWKQNFKIWRKWTRRSSWVVPRPMSTDSPPRLQRMTKL